MAPFFLFDRAYLRLNALSVLLWAALGAAAVADSLPPVQRTTGTLGNMTVIVALVPHEGAGGPVAGTYELQVESPEGRLLWNSGSLPSLTYGPSSGTQLQAVGDFLGNATPTVVVSTPTTGAEPPDFYFFRWTEGRLELAREARLVEHHGVFRYTNDRTTQGTWISGFLSTSNGPDQVHVEGVQGVRILHGLAEVHAEVDGFRLIRYTETLQP